MKIRSLSSLLSIIAAGSIVLLSACATSTPDIRTDGFDIFQGKLERVSAYIVIEDFTVPDDPRNPLYDSEYRTDFIPVDLASRASSIPLDRFDRVKGIQMTLKVKTSNFKGPNAPSTFSIVGTALPGDYAITAVKHPSGKKVICLENSAEVYEIKAGVINFIPDVVSRHFEESAGIEADVLDHPDSSLRINALREELAGTSIADVPIEEAKRRAVIDFDKEPYPLYTGYICAHGSGFKILEDLR